jgi:hypothetical protein
MNAVEPDSANFPAKARGGVSMRLAMLTYLGAMASGCVLAFYGVVFWRLDLLGGAVVAGTISWLTRLVVTERLGADATVESVLEEDEVTAVENEGSPSGRVSGLVNLLQTWEVLEKERGLECFDPWAVQSLRNDIRNAVRDDPELAQLFRTRS